MKKSQLNAISRSYTAKYQKEARERLAKKGIDFDSFCFVIGYKGSPCKLLTSINAESTKTMANVERYHIIRLYNEIDRDISFISNDKEIDWLTINSGKDGKTYAWFFDGWGATDKAVCLDDGEIIGEERTEALFC